MTYPDIGQENSKTKTSQTQRTQHNQSSANIFQITLDQIDAEHQKKKATEEDSEKPWYGAGWWKQFICEMKLVTLLLLILLSASL